MDYITEIPEHWLEDYELNQTLVDLTNAFLKTLEDYSFAQPAISYSPWHIGLSWCHDSQRVSVYLSKGSFLIDCMVIKEKANKEPYGYVDMTFEDAIFTLRQTFTYTDLK